MPRLNLHSSLALSLILCSGLQLSAAETPDSTVVARVGDTQVTAAEVRDAIKNLEPATQAAAAKDPETLTKVVRAILTQRLVLKEALAKKWDQDPAVTAALTRLRDTAIVQTYIESVSKPDDAYPSAAEAQTAYDDNKSKLIVPRQLRLAQIFVKNVKGSDAATAAKAQVKLDGVKKSLAKKDADFAAIASADSDDPDSAAKGGEIGWLADNKIQPQVLAKLGTLTKGSVSQPVQLDDGWHIIKVLDVKDSHTPTFEEIHAQLAQQMRTERARANSQQYIAKLLQDNPIQLNELNLSTVLKPQ